MLAVDIWIHIYSINEVPCQFNTFETIVIVFLRLIQQNMVNFYLYYMLYWPYRHSFDNNKGYDVAVVENEISDLSILK